MNTDPREFELQERALREDAAWRDVARALRRSPGEPPADFAASIAALAAAEAAPARTAATPEGRIERWLLRALAVVLGVSCVVALAIYGGEWLGGITEGFDAIAPAIGGASALNWALAAGACMALSWAFARSAPRLMPPMR
ncbi:MAG: hypothetical protein ACTHOC_08215 [Luteimonas sp.]